MRLIVAVAIVVIAGIASAADVDLGPYSKLSQSERLADLAKSKFELLKLSKHRDPESAAKRDDLEKRIAYIENPLNPYFANGSFNWESLRVGTIGRINNRLIDVRQVIDKKSALTNFSYYTEDEKEDSSDSITGEFRTRRGLATGSNGREGTAILLKNVNTEGWANGEGRLISGVFAVTGSETYATAAGSNTVLVLDHIDTKKNVDRFTRKHDSRVWTSSDGSRLRAVFVKVDRGKVTVVKDDGKQAELLLSSLSDDDAGYVKAWIQQLSYKPRK